MHSQLPSSPESPPGEPGPTLRDPTPIITITPPQPQARSAYEFEMEYLQRCIRATHSRLQQKTSELNESRAQIEDDTRVIARQNEQIAALEDLVHKQKITISNQSKTISDPRLLRRVQVGTSSTSPLSVSTLSSASAGGVSLGVGGGCMLPSVHHHGQQLPVGGGVFETNPPVSSASSVFDLGGGSGSGARHDAVAGGLGLSCEDSANVSSQVQQAQAQAQAQAQTQLLAGKPPSSVCDPVAWSTGTSPCASPYLNPGTCLLEIASRFRELWAKTELFGQIYANTPNAFKDSHLDIRVKDYVMSVSDRHGASSLLDSPATRFFLVAKAINFFLAREVLKVTMIRGFNDQADAEILSLKEQITPHTAPHVRHLLAISIVTQIQLTRNKPGFADFCRHKTRENMLRLWPLIGPLTDIETLSQAWTDLSCIIADAQNLALDMFSVPFEYKADFPIMGDLVNPSTMINTDPFVPGEPQGLASSDWRVRLGVTPVVHARDNSSSDAAAVSIVSLGHVLLRPGQAYR